jgi:Ca2+/Na+ antiporter
MSRRVKMVSLFGIGVLLIFPFTYWFTLLLGVGFLLAFVVYGVFTVAEPGFLEADAAEPAEDKPPA